MTETIKVDEILYMSANWRHDSLGKLNIVLGCSDLLLDGAAGQLNEDQHELVEIIHRQGLTAVESLHLSGMYLNHRYGGGEGTWQKVDLAGLMEKTLSYLGGQEEVDTEQIQVDLPSQLPPIRAPASLQTAILYLLDPGSGSSPSKKRLVSDRDYPISIEAVLTESSTILVRIRNRLKQVPDDNEWWLSRTFFPGTRLSVAEAIVKLHGSKLETQLLTDAIQFQFTLPVMEDT